MKIWIEIDKNNRLTAYSSTPIESFFEVETDKEPVEMPLWKYSGGQLIYDPDGYVPPEMPEPEPSEYEIIKAENQQLKEKLDLSEAVALEAMDGLFRLKEEIETLKGGESNG